MKPLAMSDSNEQRALGQIDKCIREIHEQEEVQMRVLGFRDLYRQLQCTSTPLADAVLAHGLDKVLELQGDSSFHVRRQVALLATSLALSMASPSLALFQKLFSCLMLLLEDSKPQVVRTVVSLNIRFQRFCALKPRDAQLVQLVNRLRDRSVSKYETCSDDGLRNRIIGLLQQLVELYGSGVVSKHLFVTGQDLDILKHLSGLIGHRKSSAANIGAISNALCAIARLRPQYVNECITPLLSLQRTRRPAHIPEAHWNRVLGSLRFALAFLVDFKPALRFRDPISAALRRLSALLRSSRQKRKSTKDSEETTMVNSSQLKTVAVSANLYDTLHRLPKARSVELALATLAKFRVPDLEKAQGMIEAFQEPGKNTLAISERKKALFDELPGLSRMSNVLETLMGNLYSASVEDPRLRSKSKQAALKETKSMRLLMEVALKEQRAEILRQLRRSFVPPLQIKSLDGEEQAFLQTVCLKRICFPKNPLCIRQSGVMHLHENIVSRVVALLALNSGDVSVVSSLLEQQMFVSQSFPAVLKCLYLLYTDPNLSQYYEQCVLQLYDALLATKSALMRRFLVEVPFLCPGIMSRILGLCESHIMEEEGINEEDNNEDTTEDHGQQTAANANPSNTAEQERIAADIEMGLFMLCDIVILRPCDRNTCLEQLLGYCTSSDRTLSQLALTLVTKTLFPHRFLSQRISAHILGILQLTSSQSLEPSLFDPVSASNILCIYLDLCLAQPDLLHDFVRVYAVSGKDLRTIMRKDADALIKTLGMDAPQILQIVREVPEHAESFVLQVLRTLTATQQLPSPELVKAVLHHYERVADARFLVPVLPGLKKQQLLESLPKLIQLQAEHVRMAVDKLVNYAQDVLSPTELLVRLHTLAPRPKHPLLKEVGQAINFCFRQEKVADPTVLGSCLQQLSDLTPMPILTMKTFRRTLEVCESLQAFVIGLLERLIGKKIWKVTKLWTGFLKCCIQTAPQSYHVLLSLPRRPFKKAVSEFPELIYPLYMCIESQAYLVSRDIRAIIFDQMYRLQQEQQGTGGHAE